MLRRRLEKLGNLRRQVLAVGVEGDHGVEAAAEQVGKGGGERRPLAAVAGKRDHPRRGPSRLFGGGVRRAVVHHQYFRQEAQGAAHHLPH
jgi:hypothetical protein